jgi:cytochrome c55X
VRPFIAAKTLSTVAAAALVLATPVLANGIPDAEKTELIRLVRQDCGSCHGMTLQGGLGTPLTREALADRTVETLAATILYGRPGSAMPPWKTLLSEQQANWIAEQLLSGFPEEKR